LQMPGGKPLTVRTPIGVKDGQKIRLAGKGKQSPNGGDPGDVQPRSTNSAKTYSKWGRRPRRGDRNH
ncbi:DnaJ C-terminal domain-containing protein, partial [Streptomyces sp. NPDC054770]